MAKNKKFKKREKKGVFDFDMFFVYDPLEVWRVPSPFPKKPKRVFYRWAKSRVKNFKRDQKRKKKNYREDLKSYFSFKKDGFFLTLFKSYIYFFSYVLIPLCICLILFNGFFFAKPWNAIELVKEWNALVPDYAVTYRDFVLFFHYYFSPMVITLKIFFYPPIFLSHLFVIWYVHINTKWNDYMERKLISISVWRLGIGYIPAAAEILNSWVFWGERFYIDFYRNVLITGPFFAIRYFWKFLGDILNIIFKIIIIFMHNIFK